MEEQQLSRKYNFEPIGKIIVKDLGKASSSCFSFIGETKTETFKLVML